MRFFSKLLVAGLCGIGLQACSVIDDYVLGKDNTLKPKPLSALQAKVTLQQIWSAKVGKSHQSKVYYKLKPVTVGHTIYTADASGRISAVSNRQGKILWTNSLPHEVISGPSVAKGYVVVGTEAGTLVALSQTDGHLVWEAQLSGDALAKSAINDHIVIAKTIDGHLYALDLATGQQIWMVDHGAPNLILKASSAPLVSGNVALVGYSDGKLDAIDLNKGRMVWQRSIAYANGASDVERLVDIDADPILRGHSIYLASYQGYIGAMDLNDGQFTWSKRASVYKNMAMDSDTLYVTDSYDVLRAYQLSTGQIKWKQTALKGYGVTEPVLLGSRVVVGDKSGFLHVLAKSNGDMIGRENVGSPITISPEVSGQRIAVMTTDGLLHVYRMKSI